MFARSLLWLTTETILERTTFILSLSPLIVTGKIRWRPKNRLILPNSFISIFYTRLQLAQQTSGLLQSVDDDQYF